MAGITFLPRETKARPGVYVRTLNLGGPQIPSEPSGVVGICIASSWGPLNIATEITSPDDARTIFASSDTGPLMQAFAGGANTLQVCRVGSGGVVATYNLMDVTPGVGVTINAKYKGVYGNGAAAGLKVTVRDDLVLPTTTRNLLVYLNSALVEQFNFPKNGSAGAGATESDDIVAAVAAKGSNYIATTRGVGVGITIPAITSQSLASGADPTVAAGDYSAGFTVLEPGTVPFNVFAIDSNDASIQASVGTYVSRIRDDGKRVMAVVGEPTSVAIATRMTNAAAFNNLAVVYVANGFVDSGGVTIEGAPAAARVAGMIAMAAYTESMTRKVVANASSVVGGMTGTQIVTAINSGAVVFSLNALGQVAIEYGITTLVSLSGQLDAGWKKIRRVRTRDTIISRTALITDPLIGNIDNNGSGQAIVIGAIQGVINAMIAEGGLRAGGFVTLDPANPPSGDSLWLVIGVDDLDSAEKFYEAFGFRFSPPVTTV